MLGVGWWDGGWRMVDGEMAGGGAGLVERGGRGRGRGRGRGGGQKEREEDRGRKVEAGRRTVKAEVVVRICRACARGLIRSGAACAVLGSVAERGSGAMRRDEEGKKKEKERRWRWRTRSEGGGGGAYGQ